MDGITRSATALNQDARRDQTSASQATSAMNQDAFAGIEALMVFPTDGLPSMLKAFVRHIDVADREMNPAHRHSDDVFAECRYLQQIEFMDLDQGNDRAGSPVSDHLQVIFEIAIPSPWNYDSFDTWYAVFKPAAGEANPQLAQDAVGESILDFLDDTPLRKAYQDMVEPK